MRKFFYYLIFVSIVTSCATNPYKKSEKVYDEKLKSLQETISNKEPVTLPLVTNYKITIDSLYSEQLLNVKDSISKIGLTILKNGVNTEWIGTVNLNLRKPNLVIIHHTAQDSIQQTIKTFTRNYFK